jgi:hypothetical protein
MVYNKKYNLFLDDIRVPADVLNYQSGKIYTNLDWVICRNYEQFVNCIKDNGMPLVVSFDHDLADSHYTPEYFWNDYQASKEWQEAQVHTEKTGYECAKWLIDYFVEFKFKNFPEYLCHSQNPVGKDNILNLLNNFKKHLKNV